MDITCKAYSYDSIFYDDWNKCVQQGDLDFYLGELKNLFAGKRVLEFACGTGRIIGNLQRYISFGMGVDSSKEMLRIAVEHYGSNDNLNFVLGNMVNFETSTLFDTILCGYNSLQHITNEPDLLFFFQNCVKLLKENGFLIIDVFQPNSIFLSEDPVVCKLGDFYSKYLDKEVHVSEKRFYDSKNRINHITTIYESDGVRYLAEAEMKQFYSGTLETYANVGFKLIKKYGNYSGDEFDLNSPKQIFIFKKAT